MKRWLFITEITLIFSAVVAAGIVGICSASGSHSVSQQHLAGQAALSGLSDGDSSVYRDIGRAE